MDHQQALKQCSQLWLFIGIARELGQVPPELSEMGMGSGIDILISSHVTLTSFSGWWPQPQVDWSGSLPHPSMVNGLELCSFRRIACRDIVKNGYIRWKQVTQKILVSKSSEESVRVKITSCRSLWCCQALGRDLTERWRRVFRLVCSCFLTVFSFFLFTFFLAFCFSCAVPHPSSFPFPHFLLPFESFFPAMFDQRRKCSMVDHPQKA